MNAPTVTSTDLPEAPAAIAAPAADPSVAVAPAAQMSEEYIPSDNFLGVSTPSDVSTANSPAIAPTALPEVEASEPATGDSFCGGAPSPILIPPQNDHDMDDEFIPRGKAGQPISGPLRPQKPSKPLKPLKPATARP